MSGESSKAARQRRLVEAVRVDWGVSQRRACATLDVNRSTCQYRSRRLAITAAGFAALGLEPVASEPLSDDATVEPGPGDMPALATAARRPGGKLGAVVDAIARPEGATLEELVALSGWLHHTTRAAVTRLRQRGHDVTLRKVDGRKAYRLAARPEPMRTATAKSGGVAARSAPNFPDLQARLQGLGALPVPELKALWLAAWGSPSPKGARRRLLMLGIAWRWQADALGGFRPETARRLAALEKVARRDASLAAGDLAAAARPRPGARLIRDWGGVRHEVSVTHEGYLWQGRSFGSLSAVARAITGSNRNGPAFFGLRDARAGRA